jgi:CHRD domain-containing protein
LVGAGLLALTGCGEDKFIASTQLSGAAEVPPVTTTASGTATATLDDDELKVVGSFAGLTSDLQEVSGSSAHVHVGAAGTSGPIVFNLTVTSTDMRNGTFEGTRTLNDDERDDFKDSLYYVNVHTTNNPTGEIRGQFIPVKQDD